VDYLDSLEKKDDTQKAITYNTNTTISILQIGKKHVFDFEEFLTDCLP
jgi:hypothetical protein